MTGETAAPSRVVVGAVLAVAIAAISTAAILIRLSTAPPITIAFWRLLLATLLLAPPTLVLQRRALLELRARDLAILALVGAALAIHFSAWIASLSYTSVAASVVLVTMHPVLVGVASDRLFGEGLTRKAWGGVAVALAGAAIIAVGAYGLGGTNLVGDGLAIVGALAVSAYLIAGRSYRRRLPLLPYVLVVYAAATVVLGVLAVGTGEPLLGYSTNDYLLFLTLAVGPMILGHTLINWSLGHVRAPVVSTTILGEPVGATILAALVLHEVPHAVTVVGGAVVLAGIWVVAREATEERREGAPPPGETPVTYL